MTRNAKGSSSARRNMKPHENMNLHKGMRNTGNGDCKGKEFFLLFKSL